MLNQKLGISLGRAGDLAALQEARVGGFVENLAQYRSPNPQSPLKSSVNHCNG
jgi:hypothetical protein